MTDRNGNKTSAELEHEVDEQRSRVEARIGAIKERLSPGQLVDEALSYTKNGGAQFARNLGHQLSANPLPAALVGVGLAWLISSSVNPQGNRESYGWSRDEDADYPYARAAHVRRVGHKADDTGQWWSEFETDSGDHFKAAATEQGHRAGHFVDASGKKFSGFIDEAGHRVRDVQDEAGNMLDQATGWASHGWKDMRRGMGEQVHAAADAASSLVSQGRDLGRDLGGRAQSQSEQLTRQITALFDQQPLIAGALAFAAGAALGAALPHTEQEDAIVGEQADQVRDKVADAAGTLYARGKEQVAEAYEKASEVAVDVYGQAKDRVAEAGTSDATGRSNGP